MDVKFPLLVVGCADRHVHLGSDASSEGSLGPRINFSGRLWFSPGLCYDNFAAEWHHGWQLRLVYNLQAIQQNPQPYKQGQTALKLQTRAICAWAFCFAFGHCLGRDKGQRGQPYRVQVHESGW